ncbi:cysteine desulfurase family protein [Edaphobacillus lindanitolerans]|uniref:Cysteine desulfurase n=1 Tax=Edaphobacillus lindanitolerans TaxID=550447 RepID=A0A1U7PMP4_9BACI|nr:cysteine desulfurase family protein [Edaphobacillus lindanitolerans]SIT85252.1 cysteine desulfurase [Edaphobacillus lindanitolerans]
MIYFDNSATTQPDPEVLRTFTAASQAFFANPSSLHGLGIEADRLLGRAAQQVAELAGMPDGTVVFTSGGTEANNQALFGFARANAGHGRRILISSVEHPSVLNTAEQLEAEGFEVLTVGTDGNGRLDLSDLERKLSQKTIVVSIMHVNNETGAIQPLEEAGRLIRRKAPRAVFHSDTVQSYGKLAIPGGPDGPDAISVSAHKFHGLKGSGALILKRNAQIRPYLFGGGQQGGLRSGTVPVAHAAALAKAMRLAEEARGELQFGEWRDELIRFFGGWDKVRVLGGPESAPHILSVAIRGIRGEVAVNALQEKEIYVSTSSACSSRSRSESHVLRAMRIDEDFRHGVIRLSFGRQNSREEILRFKEVFAEFMDTIERV